MNKQKLTYKPLIRSVIVLCLTIIIVQWLGRVSVFVNDLYPQFYRWFYPLYTKAFGWMNFSIGDVFYGLMILYFIVQVYNIIRCILLHQRWRAMIFLSKLIYFISIIYLMFHVLWGFNYYRDSLFDKFEAHDYSANELKATATMFLNQCLELRPQAVEDEQGVFYYSKKDFLKEAPNTLTSHHPFSYIQIPTNAKKKWSLYSWFMRYFGVSGYYNPFTAEAQVTKGIPAVSLPFTMAHEQAHQMGYAPEYEANFIGFLTCYHAQDVNLKYSANYKALKYLLRDIYKTDPVFVQTTLDKFSPAMKRDYKAEKLFYLKYDGKAGDVFSQMNHIYLKSNKQEKGIESYNQFVDLIMRYGHGGGL